MSEFEIAKLIEFNAKAESQAIYDYTEFLSQVAIAEIDDEMKEEIASEISEIVSDELNHQTRLHALYEKIAGIKENKN